MQPDRDEKLRTMEDIAHRALPHWDLGGAELELLKYRENAVFKVSADHGRRFALRVHRPGYHSDAALRSELRWMEALQAAGIDVPGIVPTKAGASFAVVDGGQSAPVQVDMFEWIEGRQLGAVETGLAGEAASLGDLYRTLGVIAGRLHNHAQDWQPPVGFVRHAWDEHGLAGERPFWGRFWEHPALTPDRRRLLTAARERVYADLAATAKLPHSYSMIHADFCPENLLVDGTRVRLIDFDDAGFGWHLFELVTPLYFLVDQPGFGAIKDAVIDGYRSARPLPDSELEQLPLFMLARGLTYVGWVHTRPETETARDMTPALVDRACTLAEDYLGTPATRGYP